MAHINRRWLRTFHQAVTPAVNIFSVTYFSISAPVSFIKWPVRCKCSSCNPSSCSEDALNYFNHISKLIATVTVRRNINWKLPSCCCGRDKRIMRTDGAQTDHGLLKVITAEITYNDLQSHNYCNTFLLNQTGTLGCQLSSRISAAWPQFL